MRDGKEVDGIGEEEDEKEEERRGRKANSTRLCCVYARGRKVRGSISSALKPLREAFHSQRPSESRHRSDNTGGRWEANSRNREIEKCRRQKPGEVVFLKTYFIHLPIIWIRYLKNHCFNDTSLYQWQTFLRCFTYTIKLERVLLFEDNR